MFNELQVAYTSLNVTEEEKQKWLYQHAEKPIQPLWYFTVSLCRILQTADYTFQPHEAYWLGFVDEVPGSGLPNMRQMIEADFAKSEEAKTEAFSTASLPPA